MSFDETSLTPQEVAEKLKIAKNTVYELIKRGQLNSYRVGKKVRIDLKDVEDYKKNSKRGKSPQTSEDFGEYANDAVSSRFETIPASGFIICGQDPLLDMLSIHLQKAPNGFRSLRSYMGSYNGLYALYNGNVQLATCHLWDGDSDEYNIPYVKRMLPGVPSVIIHLAKRMQGFYVFKGNPKGIKDWKDLGRTDITIINREKGSGTRVLLDEHIKKLNIPCQSIKGYNRECVSHLAAASAVARGGADIAFGIEKAGMQVKEIDFIPMQKERYEMVIKKEDIYKPYFSNVLKILKSTEFKEELEGLGGYDLRELGKITAEV